MMAHPEVSRAGRGGATIILPGETEAALRGRNHAEAGVLDLKATHRVSARLFQIDYLFTKHGTAPYFRVGEEGRPQTASLGNGAKNTNLSRVGQRGAEDFGSASRNGEDRSPGAAGPPG